MSSRLPPIDARDAPCTLALIVTTGVYILDRGFAMLYHWVNSDLQTTSGPHLFESAFCPA